MMPAMPRHAYIFVVPDCDEAIAFYVGVPASHWSRTFRGSPRREPYGTVAVFQDPFGNAWDLIQPAFGARP